MQYTEFYDCVGRTITLCIRYDEKNITGTYNFTNPGTISHNEILDMYIEIVDPTFEYKNFTLEEQDKILKSARSNNRLDTSKLTALYPEIKNIKESVRDCLLRYIIPNIFQ